MPNLSDWINNSTKWTENIPSPSLPSSFEKELLRAGGTDAKGNPNFRIVFGQDFAKARVWSRYANDWFPRYWYRTVRKQVVLESPAYTIAPVSFQYTKIGTPRFYIECRLNPEVAYASGTQAGIDSDGQLYSEAHIDSDGEWWTFMEVCSHTPECHAFADKQNSTCHGFFELPGEKQLTAVRAYRHWLATEGLNPNKPVTDAFKAQAFRDLRYRDQQNRELLEREMELATKSFLNTHIHMLSDDPKVAKSGRYHDMAKSYSRSKL